VKSRTVLVIATVAYGSFLPVLGLFSCSYVVFMSHPSREELILAQRFKGMGLYWDMSSQATALKRAMLRHFLAAIAYRTQKALRGSPAEFAAFNAGNRTRTPKELVRHMSSVLGYARTFFIGGSYHAEPLETMADEIVRFHSLLRDIAKHLENGTPMTGIAEEHLLQGPLSDVMTHVGQLAMLRRLAGAPVAPENSVFADVRHDRLGPDQPLPAVPDADWPERL
jgi:hypothetical protein